jgi:shikimate kinase
MENPEKFPLILLIGPKHAGKTSAGRALAALRGGGFVDLDEAVEARTGKSPRTLFKEGPEVFRRAEAEALESLIREAAAARGPLTAAAGGGIIDNGAARALLERVPALRTVYLEVSAETAWERIQGAAAAGGELPPFLDTADPRAAHFRLHTRRAGAYKEFARHTVGAEGKSPEQIAGEIFSLFPKEALIYSTGNSDRRSAISATLM